MCGIVGILSASKKEYIQKSNQSIHHRGPDDDGFYMDRDLALAHQRLSILDLSLAGHQPMTIENDNIVMVFNGEIYNHMNIRDRLQCDSYKSHTDTETILQGYLEFGVEIFAMMNGIFALAIYDKKKGKLILCRDQFGVKPLYYYFKNSELIFGSEIKSFLSIPGWDKSIDYKALSNYINFLWSPGEQTPFLNIKKFPVGHYMELDVDKRRNPVFTQFYNIPFDNTRKEMSEEEWIDEVDSTFSKAVERQLLSDVPVGFFLSGGLDSSIIVAKARELTGERLQCFTIDTDMDNGGKEGFANDLEYAKRVATDLDVRLEVVPSKVDIVNDFDRMIWHLDEPQADAAPLNVLNICTLAQSMDYKVLLGGTGGDDLFSGYRRHQALNFEKYFKYCPAPVAKLIQKTIGLGSSQIANVRRAKKILKDAHKGQLERLVGYYSWLPSHSLKSLFSDDVSEVLNEYDPNSILKESLSEIPNEKDLLNQMLYWDMKYFLTDHNLNYTDKMSMATGVEVRVPFLDIDLVNMSTTIPTDLKMKGNSAKYILKKVGERYLNKEVIYRPKTGFGAPVRKWITEDLDDMIHEYLDPKKIEERGIFNVKKVWNLIENNKNGKVDGSYSIWCLLAIESWFRQFVD